MVVGPVGCGKVQSSFLYGIISLLVLLLNLKKRNYVLDSVIYPLAKRWYENFFFFTFLFIFLLYPRCTWKQRRLVC